MKTLIVVIAAIFVTTICLAEEISLQQNQKEEDIKTLTVTELEKRLEAIDKEIGELEVQADYLKTEPPDSMRDSALVERSGFGSEGQVKSNLLNPKADYETVRRLKELRRLRQDIEKELKVRDSESISGACP